MRFRVGTGWAEVMCDYGAEPYVVPGGKIMVRTVGWVSRRSCDYLLQKVIYYEKSYTARNHWYGVKSLGLK